MSCTYCASPAFWGRKVRRRSVENVYQEIVEVHQKYKVQYIDFIDDIFTLDSNWVKEFCEKLIKAKLKIKWSCISDPKGTSYEILSLMKKAGCNTIKIGLQSASPEVLTRVKRSPMSPQRTLELIANAKKLGFLVYLDFIFGLPGETRESLLNNIDFALKANPTIAKFYKLAVLEGTELYKIKDSKYHDLKDSDIEYFYHESWKRFYYRPGKLIEIFIWLIRNPNKFKLIFNYLGILMNVRS